MAKNRVHDIRVRIAALGITANEVIAGIRDKGLDISQASFSKAVNKDTADLTERDYEILGAADAVLKLREARI